MTAFARWRAMAAAALALVGLHGVAWGVDGIDNPKDCAFDITGTWESIPARAEAPTAVRYRFSSDGHVVALTRSDSNSAEWVEKPGATVNLYRLDDPAAPSRIELFDPGASSPRSSQEISEYGDGGFTTMDENSQPRRWVRVEEHRYFILFVAKAGEVAKGGPAFVTLVRAGTDGRANMDSFGFYIVDDVPIMGRIPTAVTAKYLFESQLEGETQLRLELTRAEYERASAVLASWDRRVREKKLLYDTPYLNSIVFMEQVAISLNQCSERVQAERVDWRTGSPLMSRNHPQIPYYYVRELRRKNDALHLGNEAFRARMGGSCSTCRPQEAARPQAKRAAQG